MLLNGQVYSFMKVESW